MLYIMTENVKRSPYPFTKYGANHADEIFRWEPFKNLDGHQNQAGYVVYGLTPDTGGEDAISGTPFCL